MKKLSYSALQTFNTCPLQYKFAYRDRLPTEQTTMMYFGTIVHQLMEELYAPTLLPVSKEELLHMLITKWKSVAYKDTALAKKDIADATTILERECEKRYKESDIRTIALEQSFSFPITAEFTMRGRIDRVDKLASNSLEIIDYKTGYNPPSETELKQNLQLATYFLAAKNLWPEITTIRLTLHYLRPDKVVSFTPERSFAAETQSRLSMLVNELKTSDFAPRPGKHCDQCSFRTLCPLMKSHYMQTL